MSLNTDQLKQRVEDLVMSCADEGWDSYGAAPVQRAALESAVSFVENVWLGPSNDGGAILEDCGGSLEFIIQFLPDGRLEGVYIKDGDWEFEVNRPTEIADFPT